MDIAKYTSRCESGPEIITVNFPDDQSRGEETKGTNPRNAWIELADEKARELGVSFVYDLTENGLEVEFKSRGVCDALLEAIEPDWNDRLVQSFSRTVHYAEIAQSFADEHRLDSDIGNFMVHRVADEYGLSVHDVAEAFPEVNELVRD